MYGYEGDASGTGYNSTFGNTTIWTAFSGNNILDQTYDWDNCGPFDPPEYWADYENFTVKAGVPAKTLLLKQECRQ